MRDDHQSTIGSAEEPALTLSSGKARETVVLRILATTDIHAQFLGYDYVNDCNGLNPGLAGLASLIDGARIEAKRGGMASILLDNGDLLQGTPIGQTLAAQPVDRDHPVVAGLATIGFDAIGLGNHDLDFGLDYVTALAAQLPCPAVCSNLRFDGPSPVEQAAVIRCPLPGGDPARDALRVGIISVLPEKTALWNRTALSGKAQLQPVVPSVADAVQAVRAQGADVVVLLAHMGIEVDAADDRQSEDARQLATLPGVDVMILGHTHRRLPGSDHAGLRDVDVKSGRLGARPCVMAGHDGSDLAVLDLELARSAQGRWRVRDHCTELRANADTISADAGIAALFAPAHARTRAELARPIGRNDRHLHNYFSLVMPTTTSALEANANALAVTEAIAGAGLADLPLLATASAHTAGGRGGPRHYLDIPPGPLLERHIAGLNPYANAIWGLRVTGADLRHWLERTAGLYARLRADRPGQLLLEKTRPIFDHDTIYGLTYLVDPTREIGTRIRDMRYAGERVGQDDLFILATSSFRAGGGGGGPLFEASQILCQSNQSLRSALSRSVSSCDLAFPPDSQPWRLDCPGEITATLQTSPQARHHLGDIARLSPRFTGLDAQGFARIELKL